MRLEEEWAADKDVLASLRENGDRPEIVRAVDVSFRGSSPRSTGWKRMPRNWALR